MAGTDDEVKEYDPFITYSVFPDARSVFALRLKPLEEAKESAIVVLDTNALLVPYSIGKESLDQIGATYRYLVETERLIVPGQVAREFAKNRAQKIGEIFQQLSRKRSSVPTLQKGKYPLLEGSGVYQEAITLEKKIDELLRTYRDVLGKVLNYIQSWVWDDPVSVLYSDLFTEQVVLDIEFDQKALLEDLERRRRHYLPPGYKDAGKEDGGVGDLIIWYTILEVGKQRKRDVIFVSGDQKADWWHRSEKQLLYPRYELVEEFRQKAGKELSFHIITFSQFLDLFGASKEIVQEVRAEEEKQKEILGLVGEFIRKWQQLEHILLAVHRDLYPQSSSKWRSVLQIVSQWERDGVISDEFAYQIKSLNRFRNKLIHEHTNFPPDELRERIMEIENLLGSVWTEINVT